MSNKDEKRINIHDLAAAFGSLCRGKTPAIPKKTTVASEHADDRDIKSEQTADGGRVRVVTTRVRHERHPEAAIQAKIISTRMDDLHQHQF